MTRGLARGLAAWAIVTLAPGCSADLSAECGGLCGDSDGSFAPDIGGRTDGARHDGGVVTPKDTGAGESAVGDVRTHMDAGSFDTGLHDAGMDTGFDEG